jgi:transposase InsO family protein
VKTLFIEPGSPWENGYLESFHGKLRDECLNEEIFWSRGEAQVVVDWYRDVYNSERPHSSLGYRTPVEAATGINTRHPGTSSGTG